MRLRVKLAMAGVLGVSLTLYGCVKPAVVPPPVTKPPPAAAPPPPVVEEPTPEPPPVAGPEHLAAAAAVVDGVMRHAHAAALTAPAFAWVDEPEPVGNASRDGTDVFFAVNDDIIGKLDSNSGCGPDVLRLPWRLAPVGLTNLGVEFESEPQWWNLGEAHIRVGATELVGIAPKDEDCNIWGLLVSGPPRADEEYKSPGSSGPTEGVMANIFGEEALLVLAPTGLKLGTDDPIEIVPTFEATCVTARWASDLLGTRTLRVRFTNGLQPGDCPDGDTSEEFVQSRSSTGELVRTERIRDDPAGVVREDHVIRTVGTGRLIWDATTTTTTTSDADCWKSTEEIVGRWTFTHPTRPTYTAAGRRVRSESTCPITSEPAPG